MESGNILSGHNILCIFEITMQCFKLQFKHYIKRLTCIRKELCKIHGHFHSGSVRQILLQIEFQTRVLSLHIGTISLIIRAYRFDIYTHNR